METAARRAGGGTVTKRDVEPITVTLPLPPNLANGRGHSRWIGAAKKRYFAQLDHRQNCGLIQPPPERAIERVVITSVAYVGAPNDSENMHFRAYKWPCDWLRTRGYIVNDDPSHCTMVQPEQVVKRGQVYRVVLTLTPRDAA